MPGNRWGLRGIIWGRSSEDSLSIEGAAGGGWMEEGEKQGHRIVKCQNLRNQEKRQILR